MALPAASVRSLVLLLADVRASRQRRSFLSPFQEKAAIAALIGCWGVARPGAGLCRPARSSGRSPAFSSAALVIRGEPGVGKTALPDYAAEHAAGLQRASGDRCPVGGDSAFAALHQLLYPVLDQLSCACRGRSPGASSAAFGLTLGSSDDPFLVAVAGLTLGF